MVPLPGVPGYGVVTPAGSESQVGAVPAVEPVVAFAARHVVTAGDSWFTSL